MRAPRVRENGTAERSGAKKSRRGAGSGHQRVPVRVSERAHAYCTQTDLELAYCTHKHRTQEHYVLVAPDS